MRLLASTCVLLLTACSPLTEVLVTVSAEQLAVPAELDSVRISVTNPSESDPTAVVFDSDVLPLCGGGLPGRCFDLPLSVTLTPGGSRPDATVRVLVEGFAGGAPIESDASLFAFQPGQRQHLEMVLRPSCKGTMCSATDSACDATGTCVHLAPRGGDRALLGFDALRYDYGAIAPGGKSSRVFNLQNLGSERSGPVAVNLIGAPEFSLTVNSCQGIPLGPPCSVTVTFSPTDVGARTATLTATASPGGSASVELVNVKQPATLAGDTSHDFGDVEIGVASTPSYSWVITNTGALPTGVPTLGLSGDDPDDFMTSNGCTTPLAPGESCTIGVSLMPSAGGVRSALLTLAAMPGGVLKLAATGQAGYALTVVTSAPIGSVTSTPLGIDCGSACKKIFPVGANVALSARTLNGGGAHFVYWGGDCVGSFHDCSVVMSAPRTVGARFDPIDANLVFVTSSKYPATLGGTAAYDATCNGLASSAGINNSTGDAYVAWLSDANSSAKTRLGSAAGFVRLDSQPVADTQSKLFGGREILNPIAVTELGQLLISNEPVWTGNQEDGSPFGGTYCMNWTLAAGTAPSNGNLLDGPVTWTSHTLTVPDCATNRRFYCMMKTQVATVAPVAPAGAKLAYMAAFTPGGSVSAAHTACDAVKPAAIAGSTVRALLATTLAPASTYLNPAAVYVRPDGVVVGSGAELIKGNGRVRSGIWQLGNGTYDMTRATVFTGASDPTILAGPLSNCTDWTSSSGQPTGGRADTVDDWWSTTASVVGCGTGYVYCVEQ